MEVTYGGQRIAFSSGNDFFQLVRDAEKATLAYYETQGLPPYEKYDVIDGKFEAAKRRWSESYPTINVSMWNIETIPLTFQIFISDEKTQIAKPAHISIDKAIALADEHIKKYMATKAQPVMDQKTRGVIIEQTKIRWAALYPGVNMLHMVIETPPPSPDLIIASEGSVQIAKHSGTDLNKVILDTEIDIQKYLTAKKTASVSSSSYRG